MVGWGAVIWGVLGRIGASVAIAPTLGFIGGFVLMVVLLWAFRRSAPFPNESCLQPSAMAYYRFFGL